MSLYYSKNLFSNFLFLLIKDADITQLIKNLAKILNDSGEVVISEPADYPCIVEKDGLFYFAVDGQTLSQNANIVKIFIVWLQSFHVFNIEFSDSVRKTLQHFN